MIKSTTLLFGLSAIMLAVFHYLFLELHLYWLYLWLDIPVHFLGGVTVALGFLTFLGFFPKLVDRYFTLVRTVAFVLLVASVWEVFEVSIGIPFEEGNYVGDTILDLIMGALGGMAGYFVGRRVSQLDV
ncbi:hypothetical protein H6788_01010 [Candidatus Nomurabacteria bacterium]|nr:hypothetical protein [Candidatus Nomurabacteria bacterium]